VSELKTTEAYLAIEKARFKDRLNVRMEVDGTVDVSVPVLSIQPLVENALRHGILGKLEGGVLTLRVARKPDGVLVEIEDDGVGMLPELVDRLLDTRGKQGVGLANIHKRLLSLYGKGLSIDSEPGRGTRISFTVPDPEAKE
jgi:sensor histidine kinase YesM